MKARLDIQSTVRKMNSRLKMLAKKFLPSFLHPHVYKLYAFVNCIVTKAKLCMASREALLQFTNSEVLKNLSGLRTVQIIQPAFYDLEGECYISGGAERYLNDLSQILFNMEYTPFIVQRGNHFWHKMHGNISVFGVPADCSLESLNKFAHQPYFGKPLLRIYSPFALAFPNVDKNSIGISHGIFWDHSYGINAFLHTVTESFRHLKTLISVDTSTLCWLRTTFPNELSGKNMVYIPNYVDLQDFYSVDRSCRDRITIIYPRRLCFERGYFNVIKVADYILSKYPEVDFHFVGYGDSSAIEEAQSLIKKFKNRVLLYQAPDHEMNKVYQKADITLIPTIASEGTSLSCLEAMATGNAVIATNIGGLPNLVIDRYNGLLIDPTLTSLQNAIEELVTNPMLRQQLSVNALMIVKCFSKDIWKSKWKNILTQTLERT